MVAKEGVRVKLGETLDITQHATSNMQDGQYPSPTPRSQHTVRNTIYSGRPSPVQTNDFVSLYVTKR
jgi:hypothetical protein